ncbi:MAG: TPMT family class I SAM-dependent methyltransferase [Betaproteobacteria bacterium]|nr:TPMT family class I SAM-dependent methyltransferase [Betaproteobacteria bacterium]MCL2887258.1 TPMT family class I SAM-dependent methyltransferase [Betaproteobacteria bacterium]
MSGQTPFPTRIKPPEQRPELPEFWDKRFGAGVMPWDAGGVPAEFAAFVASRTQPLATLIPGCGSAWEAACLAAAGWPVTALDFSPTAIAQARQILGPAAVDLRCADFFSFAPARPYDLIYERAFLCALPRKLWADWGHRVAELLPPGGLLAGYFYICDQPKGPPFGILAEQLNELLAAQFALVEDIPASDPLPVFDRGERWQVWRRR